AISPSLCASDPVHCVQSAEARPTIYGSFLPLLNSPGRVELLDDPRLVSQLLSLERRTARGGRDSVDHSVGGRDDCANAAAGVLVAVAHTCLAEPTGANLSATPTRRAIDPDNPAEPYWPSAEEVRSGLGGWGNDVFPPDRLGMMSRGPDRRFPW